MADEDDVRELRRGNRDMARRDLRAADLSKMDLKERDFSGAHLEQADFSRSDLSRSIISEAHTSNMIAEDANLSGIMSESTVIFGVNFTRADLRNARFARAHFSRANLTEARLEGADFSNAVINEGTIFDGCTVDDLTQFDGASIFRPLARQPAFRNYRVERGFLVRIEQGLKKESGNRNVGLYDASSPPQSETPSGTISFDYSDHDGLAILGLGDRAFKTKWSRAGKGAIHAYVNPPGVVGIAIAENVSELDEITPDVVESLNYTSRTRQPSEGQILVARNAGGDFVAIKILAVLSKGHSDASDLLTMQYRTLTLAPSTNQASKLEKDIRSTAQQEVVEQVDTLLQNLKGLAPELTIEAAHGGIGHNNPPEETPLDRAEFDDLNGTLVELKSVVQTSESAVGEIPSSQKYIAEIARKIAKWIARKADIAADEFAKQTGKSVFLLSVALAAWSMIVGELSKLNEKLGALISLWIP